MSQCTTDFGKTLESLLDGGIVRQEVLDDLDKLEAKYQNDGSGRFWIAKVIYDKLKHMRKPI